MCVCACEDGDMCVCEDGDMCVCVCEDGDMCVCVRMVICVCVCGELPPGGGVVTCMTPLIGPVPLLLVTANETVYSVSNMRSGIMNSCRERDT